MRTFGRFQEWFQERCKSVYVRASPSEMAVGCLEEA
jgi:hypothetical protein